jgi:hypothetical protein
MIVAVSVNRSGPFDFLLDTGMQVTTLDPTLAGELHLKPQGAAVVAGVGSQQPGSYVPVDLLEAGSHVVPSQRVLVYDLQGRPGADRHIRGILAEDFLEQFDMLIDNAHQLLCLDSTEAMRADMKGLHTALILPSSIPVGSMLPDLIIVEARLSDATRTVRLMLDSGANGAVLFNTHEYMALPRPRHLEGTGVDGSQTILSVLPPQKVKIGSLVLERVPFYALDGAQNDARAKGFDGVLTLGLFRRVFIARAHAFAVLEPK